MADVLTVREAVTRAKQEGFPVSEYSLRKWVRSGEIPARSAGNKILLYYPNLITYLTCEQVPEKTRQQGNNTVILR